MRHHLLATAVLLAVPNVHAQDSTTLPTIDVHADKASRIDNIVVVENPRAQNRTLGGMLEHVPGVQSSAFGPNAGAPIIRSLGGNRVQILENGQSILGMNAMSGDIAIPFDPLFVRNVSVNKSSDTVRHGGNGIGGSVDIDSGILSRKMETTDQELELVLRQGLNAADAQGFRMNFNNQRNLSTNLQVSRQRISHYDIPSRSKAAACNTQLFPAGGGVNSALADACQKEARIQQVYNTASQPYIDQFMTENPDWADGEFSFYTNQPSSIWGGKTYVNPANPAYVAGTPSYTQNRVNRDVTPDYRGTLGNSYARSSHLAAGATYFFDRGYLGISIDAKDNEYGVPGFSMENLSFGSDYGKARPVGVVLRQDRYAMEASVLDPFPWFEKAELQLSQVSNTSGERLGSSKSNDYRFDTYQAEAVLTQRRLGPLGGMLGASHLTRGITGTGTLRYLPDVDTTTTAVFMKESIDFTLASIDVGFRHERVGHQIQAGAFKTSRNAANTRLEDRAFTLNSYSVGAYLELGQSFAAKARYSSSQRAPEVNELYASNAHYSIMTQEEGNQHLKPERARSAEATLLFNNGGFDLSATGYVMKYENYLYQGYSGLQTANRLPLKYWKQTDTTVKGLELEVSQILTLGAQGTLSIAAFSDLARNRADHPDALRAHNDGKYLPNMPTNRYGASVVWEKGAWRTRVSSTYYDKQQYLGRNVSEEIPLDAFNLVDFQLSRQFQPNSSYVSSIEVVLNGSNLLDEDARPHNSPLKYIAPLPGRAFQIGLRLQF